MNIDTLQRDLDCMRRARTAARDERDAARRERDEAVRIATRLDRDIASLHGMLAALLVTHMGMPEGPTPDAAEAMIEESQLHARLLERLIEGLTENGRRWTRLRNLAAAQDGRIEVTAGGYVLLGAGSVRRAYDLEEAEAMLEVTAIENGFSSTQQATEV